MNMNDFVAVMVPPLGGLLIGAWVYWIATRPEKKSPQHPAE